MAKSKLPECRVLWTKDVVRWALPETGGQGTLLPPDPEQRTYQIEARYSPATDVMRLYVMGAEHFRTACIPIEEGDHEATKKSLVEYGEVVGRLKYFATEKEARLAWGAREDERAAD